MRNKILLELALILVFASSLAFGGDDIGNFKPGSEPDGFRGIKWGTDISTLSGMEYLKTSPAGEIQIYTKKNDDLRIGKTEIKKILYHFWKGELYLGVILTQGYADWCGLKEAAFEKFGSQPDENTEAYAWSGDTTGVFLQYNEEIDKTGCLFMRSKKISKEMDEQQQAWNTEKAKEEAGDEVYQKKPNFKILSAQEGGWEKYSGSSRQRCLAIRIKNIGSFEIQKLYFKTIFLFKNTMIAEGSGKASTIPSGSECVVPVFYDRFYPLENPPKEQRSSDVKVKLFWKINLFEDWEEIPGFNKLVKR